MLDTVKTTIDGKTFSYLPLGASAAREKLVEIAQLLGPGAADALKSLQSATIGADMLDEDMSDETFILKLIGPISGALGGAISGFVASLSPKNYSELVDMFLSRAWMHDADKEIPLERANRETLFARSLLLEGKVLVWCLREQYADFFELLGKAENSTGAAMKVLASRLGSPRK